MGQDIKIAVTGAGGRMGATLIRLIAETGGLALAGGLEADGSPNLGADLGRLAGLGEELGLKATADALTIIKDAD
ncbi:MAG: 4-hydroxy-tetrahydrodipicolinate reductase, partial [Alphaproteobacteria bacterium HGW-Alphaproteobacteria-12]